MAKTTKLTDDGKCWKLSNASLSISIDKANGTIVSLIDRADGFDACRPDEPNAAMIGGLRITDDLSGQTFCDLTTASRVSVVEAGAGPGRSRQVVLDKRFDGSALAVRVLYRMEPECLYWQAEVSAATATHAGGTPATRAGEAPVTRAGDRSVRIVFIVPQPSRRLWGPMADPFIDLQPEQPIMIRHGLGNGRAVAQQMRGVPVPLLSFVREKRCMALALPVEVPNVLVRFMNNADERHLNVRNSLTYDPPLREYFKVVNDFLGVRQGRPATAGVLLSPHDGQWRAALGWYARRYERHFKPDPLVGKHEGVYHPGMPYGGAEAEVRAAMKGRAKRGVRWAELHGHFPWYGLYVSPTEPWKSLGGGERTFDFVRRTIRLYRQQGIKVHTYYNTIDGQDAYVEKEFPESIAVDERGERIPAYHDCWLMNADPDLPFGRHCLEQFDKLLEAYPDSDGLFYDVYGRHYDLDFGHDDGITMVHNKPAYCMKFAFARLMERISPRLHALGKLFSANKPEGIETLDGIDIIMADEGRNIARLEAFSYYGLFRPVMVLDTGMWKDPEPTLKACLRLGMMFNDFVDRGLDQLSPAEVRRNEQLHAAYAPLLRELLGKEWVLEPNAIELPESVGGNIFRVPAKAARGKSADRTAGKARGKPAGDRVIVTVVSEHRSMFEDGGFAADLPIVVRFAGADKIKRATVRSVDYTRPVKAKITRGDGALTVTVPRHRTASIVVLEG